MEQPFPHLHLDLTSKGKSISPMPQIHHRQLEYLTAEFLKKWGIDYFALPWGFNFQFLIERRNAEPQRFFRRKN
jgi:hypothetical protein